MSGIALGWAYDQQTGSLTNKAVLAALADYCGTDNEVYPSIQSLCLKLEANRKTVMKAIISLREQGLIIDTGKRVGATQSVRVYQLPCPKEGDLSRGRGRTHTTEAVPDLGPVPKTGPLKQSLIRTEAVPNVDMKQSLNRDQSKGQVIYSEPPIGTYQGTKREGRASRESDVIAYALTLSLPKSDGEYFWNTQEAGGWKRSGKAIIDWKACLRAWKSGGWLPSQKNNPLRAEKKEANLGWVDSNKSKGDEWNEQEYLEQMKRLMR